VGVVVVGVVVVGVVVVGVVVVGVAVVVGAVVGGAIGTVAEVVLVVVVPVPAIVTPVGTAEVVVVRPVAVGGAEAAPVAGVVDGAALVDDGPAPDATATTPLLTGLLELPIETTVVAGIVAATLARRPPLTSTEAR
jgi:hypothetical protein